MGEREMVSYGQTFHYRTWGGGGGSVSVSWCSTPEQALWKAAHMLFRSNLTRRQIRKAMTAEQRERLLAIARRKLFKPAATGSQ